MVKPKLQSWYKRLNQIDLSITNKLYSQGYVECSIDCPFYNTAALASCEALELTNILEEMLKELKDR